MRSEAAKILLEYSRSLLQAIATCGKTWDFTGSLPEAHQLSGAFVTLKMHGDLRGCIGHIDADMPLHKVIRDMTYSAARRDPRFRPVTEDELKDISIEISAISPFELVKNVEDIEIGKHGLMLELGYNAGLLLPQVPVEWGWDRNEFLLHLCNKAGLPPNSHKHPKAILYSFTADVFGEENFPSEAP